MTEVGEANRQRQEEQPELQALLATNEQQSVIVKDLWNRQTAIHEEGQKVKAQLHTVMDAIREAEFKLLEAKEENEALKAQIVPDPRKLKHDLKALEDAEKQERDTIRAVELKLAQHAKQREALERERDVDEVHGLQAEVEGEQAKLKEAQKQLKENAERASKDDGERVDMEHKIDGRPAQRLRQGAHRPPRRAARGPPRQGERAHGRAGEVARWRRSARTTRARWRITSASVPSCVTSSTAAGSCTRRGHRSSSSSSWPRRCALATRTWRRR